MKKMRIYRNNLGIKRTRVQEFRLMGATLLTPIEGETTVTVETTGSVTVEPRQHTGGDAEPRTRYIELARTPNARLMVSGRGQWHKVEIRLRNLRGIPSEADFVRELRWLFSEYESIAMMA